MNAGPSLPEGHVLQRAEIDVQADDREVSVQAGSDEDRFIEYQHCVSEDLRHDASVRAPLPRCPAAPLPRCPAAPLPRLLVHPLDRRRASRFAALFPVPGFHPLASAGAAAAMRDAG